jgi:hydroxymethylglutaryl-CoA lyase
VDPSAHPAARLTGRLPARVDVYEVGPRDGLQNELRIVPLDGKLRLIAALVDAGERRIEVTSFVSPRWIPQLSDAEDVLKLLPRVPGVTYSALVPNLKGLERARAAGLGEAAVFISASETHSKKNINKSIAEAVSVAGDVTKGALAAGMRVRAYLSVVWGCPYEGAVSVDRVVDLCRRLADMGIYQLSLGDTVGVGVPNQTEEILTAVTRYVPVERLALHLHDTRGLALANALVGLSVGVTTFDASIGGLGGCPYAPGAAGNLATEDVVNMLHRMGVETGIDLAKLVEAGEVAQELIGRKLSGKFLQAALGERDRAQARRRTVPAQ